MFCARCGTSLPEGAAFCHSCGARTVDESEKTGSSSATTPGVVPAPSPPSFVQRITEPPHEQGNVSQAAPPALPFTQDGVQVVIGVIVIIGAVLAIVGSFLPWVDFGFASASGFDGGYLTDPTDGDAGMDGLLSLLAGITVAGIALHYFFVHNVWAGVLVVLLGLGVAALGGYNLGRIIYDARTDLDASATEAFDLVGAGLYLVIVGGAITMLAAFVGAWRATSR